MATTNIIRNRWRWGLLLLLAAVAVTVVSPGGRPAVATGGNSITSPDTDYAVGWTPSLLLDASGRPVVAYWDDTSNDLKVMHCNDPNCAGDDESIQAPDTSGNVGGYPSLALDDSGNPVVSYNDNTNDNLKVIHCNDPDCAGGDESIEAPDTAGDVGEFSSLVLDSNGYPVIAYEELGNGDLRVMHCNDPNCDAAVNGPESITSPDTAGSVGWYTSLALDSNGYPVVSYEERAIGDLKVMHCNDANCDAAVNGPESISSPDTTGDVGEHTSLALDSDGYPVVSYWNDTNRDLKLMHCNDPSCSGNDESITAPDTNLGPSATYYGDTSLALDASGNPVVSYHYYGDGDLRVMHCNDPNCAGADESIRWPDTTGSVGLFNSLVLDSAGNPVVSYFDDTNDDLKLLHCGDADCSTTAKLVLTSTADAVDASPGDGLCQTAAPGECTLRAAIQESNALAGLQEIVVPANTYTLTIAGTGEDAAATGDLDITDDVTIIGSGADITIVDGGALDTVFHVLSGAAVEITQLTITNGSGTGYPGGISNSGTLFLVAVAVSGNQADASAGGIHNEGAMTITVSTISGNTAGSNGGGIRNAGPGTMTIVNSTISGNAADDDGGGIQQSGTDPSLQLSNVTVTGNTSDADIDASGEGGGLDIATGTALIKNSLLAGNIDPTGTAPDCIAAGKITSEGYNLVGNNTGCTLNAATGDLIGTGASPIDPLIGTLRDNGGPIMTHSLPVVSPAVDAGSPAPPGSGGNACEATDQRGEARPLDGDSNGNTRCDIGAYEAEGATTEPCPNQPDLPPPDAGCTDYSFTATLEVTATDLSPEPLDCNVSGAIVETRGALADGDTDGLDDIDIEIVFLSGFIDCPGPLFLGTAVPSTGVVEEQVNTNVGELDFPVDVEADLCLVADTYPLGELENCPEGGPTADPLQLTCTAPSMTHADCVVDGTSSFVNDQDEEKATVDSGDFELVELPPPVGGEAEALAAEAEALAVDDSSGISTGVLAGIAAAAVAAAAILGGGAWYVRRRLRG